MVLVSRFREADRVVIGILILDLWGILSRDVSFEIILGLHKRLRHLAFAKRFWHCSVGVVVPSPDRKPIVSISI